MNAQQARIVATERNTNETDSQYSNIKKQIESAAKSGKYEIFVYASLKSEVRQKLMSEGYNVGPDQFDRNETTVSIKW